MTLFAFLLVLVIGLFIRNYSLEHCLEGLKYDIETDRRLVECDEPFFLRSTFLNYRRFPVFFLEVSERVPSQLQLKEEDKALLNTARGYSAHLDESLYLLPRQKAVRNLEVSLPKRGRYLFKGATLTAGDLFGLEERSESVELMREIVVMPKKCDIANIEQAFGGYLGKISVRRFIMPDPIDTIGFREYSGREPQRDIAWPQSLRSQRLMVKTYDHTAEERATLLLDITDGEEETMEKAYSIARTIAEELEKKHIRFRFDTDASVPTGKGDRNHIPEGGGRTHLEDVLEVLGRAGHDQKRSLERLLEDTTKDKDDGRSYILVTTSKDLSSLRSYERKIGRDFFVIKAGKEDER